jgi:hypothetical protein
MVGSDDELELEACGDRLLGRWVGVVVPWGDGEGLFDDLRLEPTSLLNPAFMDDIDRGKKGRGRLQVGCTLFNAAAGELGRLITSYAALAP